MRIRRKHDLHLPERRLQIAATAVATATAIAIVIAPSLPASAQSPRASTLPERRLFSADSDDGSLPTVRFDRATRRAAARRKGRFRVSRFPLRRDLEVELELEPFRVTSARTRFVLGRKSAPDIPLDFDSSEISLFRGEVRGRPGSRVVLVLRDGHHTGSIDLGPGAPRFRISSRGRGGRELGPERASVFEAVAAPELPPGVPFCGVEGEESTATEAALEPRAAASTPAGPFVGQRHMQVAVDTDHEFFQLFGDASEAAAYLVALWAQNSDIYLRDQDTHIELTYARIWDQPDDLFNQVDPSPLSDFQSEWNANMGAVPRDVAQLLSGRRDYPFGGQAYLSAMCGANAYGVVGYIQGFFPDPSKPSPFTYDISVSAHELGHNAGTGHSHDSPNFVDSCDDPLSTPQRGSIMSYCGQTWSGGNANRDNYLHSRIQQNIDSHLGISSCIVDDCNLNNVADSLDISGATSLDVNTNGVPDECEDCDDDGTLDPQDIAMGEPDVDGNGIPDACEPDCNSNSVPDAHDISLATSLDAYGNDIPDECEVDCNSNSTSDYSEIQLDMTLDVDRNAELDACQDCDGDTTPDRVELGGAHGLWIASGLASSPIREFYASTGVLTGVSGGSGAALMAGAQDLLITPGGRVLVSSGDDDRVAEFDLSGSYLGDFISPGSGGLGEPKALVLAPNGDLLVASHLSDEVLAYDGSTGASLGAFVSAGSGGLDGPFGMAFGPNGNLFVTTEAGGVIEYNGATGAGVGSFVSTGNNGGLTDPRHILFKPDGNLLVTSFGSDETLEFQRDTGWPLGRWALSGNEGGTRLNQESPWGLRIGPSGNVFITRTGEAFGSSGGGGHDDDIENDEAGELHLTNAQIYEFDVATGNFLRAHINGNDHGMEFPTGFDFVPGWGVDCNANLTQDSCDIALGTSLDVDSGGVPDECEVDCNTNGTLDRLDIIPFGASTDCNHNLVPDECDTVALVDGPCEPVTEVSCSDGFDNDRDGLADCADSDCDLLPACSTSISLGATFPLDAESFVYADDLFRSTAQPAYASGSYGANAGFEGGGGLRVDVGGIDGNYILDMSGGWQRSFDLATAGNVTVTFRYRMDQAPTYEDDEFSQVLFASDGALVGTLGNDYIVQLTGDGQNGSTQTVTTGWQRVTLDLGVLSAGTHTIALGGYNDKKNLPDEFTAFFFDDVAILGPAIGVCGDSNVDPGEDCDDFDPCTADSCDDVTGCANDPIPFCPSEIPSSGPWGRGLLGVMLALAATLLPGIRRRASRSARPLSQSS
ncbi:MAG: hypothetical protein JRG96_18700 [Deltaproteobacteria bacterium]|nr:hypothetical protein [Deltaproteobacteria bacterium]MBW2419737.1 hypothetical protein [Deltaproteobacteria bacterium]